MKISSITLNHLRMPLVLPFETSFGVSTHRDCVLVSLHAEGMTGYGECVADYQPGYTYETSGTAWYILKHFIVPLTLGKEIEDPREFQKDLQPIKGHLMAKAGIEMALWDLLGKREGKSLNTLLGGKKKKVEVGVSVGLQESPEALVRRVEDYLKDGYRRIKIKIKPGRDVADTEAVRRAFPEIMLQVDANSAYSPGTCGALKPLDGLNLLLIEQPLAEDDLLDHARMQKKFNTPLCLDESILSARHARYALELKACRIINIKAGRLGGLGEALAVHDVCRSVDMPVWCGGMLETGVGRAANLGLASLPGFTLPGDISASNRYYTRDITHESFNLNPDSTIDVPDRPGLGVNLDEEAVSYFTLEEETFSC